MDLPLELDRAAPLPLADQLAGQLRQLVRRGALRPGDPLPTIQALADALGVNPNTVAGVYRELEAEGLLHANRRAGTRVADAPPAPPAVEGLAGLVGAELGRRLAALGVPLGDALPALAAAALRPEEDEALRVAVLGRTPLAAERAARRTAAALGDRVRCVPVTPERYRSADYHLAVIDPDLVPALLATADVIPPPRAGFRHDHDFPAGAD